MCRQENVKTLASNMDGEIEYMLKTKKRKKLKGIRNFIS